MPEEVELTPEGQQIWDNVCSLIEIERGGYEYKPPLPPKPKKPTYAELENEFIRSQLRVMINNSKKVVADCDIILENIKEMEDYLKSDAKVARYIHGNIVIRLERILNGQIVFK